MSFFIQGWEAKPHQAVEAPEGVTGVTGFSRAVSLTQIKAMDLLSDGEIDGLVEGEYDYQGTLGRIGYDSYTFKQFDAKTMNGRQVRYLRSIYWNETPVVDKTNKFNFQAINVSTSYGLPNGTP